MRKPIEILDQLAKENSPPFPTWEEYVKHAPPAVIENLIKKASNIYSKEHSNIIRRDVNHGEQKKS
ncbi:MAG: hypothetical protein HC836_37320 [Richelia sp. RM2_1_2]|nr:hypothetical protein [Richelia sp. RM2_1_2]